jgi:hypothetical protein
MLMSMSGHTSVRLGNMLASWHGEPVAYLGRCYFAASLRVPLT